MTSMVIMVMMFVIAPFSGDFTAPCLDVQGGQSGEPERHSEGQWRWFIMMISTPMMMMMMVMDYANHGGI